MPLVTIWLYHNTYNLRAGLKNYLEIIIGPKYSTLHTFWLLLMEAYNIDFAYLHWLPFDFRVQFRMLVLTYKTSYGLPTEEQFWTDRSHQIEISHY